MISYGVYLWHWPIIVYLTGSRTGLSTAALDALRIVATLVVATASYLLVERPIRRAAIRGRVGLWLAPLLGVATALVVVVATIPAVAAPGATSSVAAPKVSTHPQAVPGAGGYGGQAPITLPPSTVVSPTEPLRVLILGDSVIGTAEPAITAALASTGEATVFSSAIDGFGLTTVPNWSTDITNIIEQRSPRSDHRVVELGRCRSEYPQRLVRAAALPRPAHAHARGHVGPGQWGGRGGVHVLPIRRVVRARSQRARAQRHCTQRGGDRGVGQNRPRHAGRLRTPGDVPSRGAFVDLPGRLFDLAAPER